jgi:23S rRNA (uracil1939-C5)-methyltransferase
MVAVDTVCARAGKELVCQRYGLTEDVWSYVPLGAFMQINRSVNQLLVSHLRQGAQHRGVEDFADLFCGAGNLSLPLVALGMKGRGAEQNRDAVAALRRALTDQRLEGFSAFPGDVGLLAQQWLAEGQRFDLVVANPPRAGLGEAVSLVAALSRRYVVLCSCNPETLGRDLAWFLQEGFIVEQATVFDMFPQTHHLEVFLWLARHR